MFKKEPLWEFKGQAVAGRQLFFVAYWGLKKSYHPYTDALIQSFQFKRHAALREKASSNACPFSDRCNSYKKVCDTFPPITQFPARGVACYFPLKKEISSE